ncbi:hypothetical protein BCR44DRAFT_1461707 [Catenaria anguillulae PL171]|uniref:Uncharacterized protein n=1 Tax=Catenaria anguillulae PL171 TaxID=765915 RepID=A0A1Y2HJ58_9FUNG|nr:hypothetical protein BCR44DRAFT_1461707 [Catenaria anguillulae PL171]
MTLLLVRSQQQYPHNHNHNHTGSLQQHHHHRHQNNNMNGFSTSPSAPTHFGNASSPAIFPAIQQHLLQHTHAAFVWHPTSASAPSDSALTRQGNAILALYHAQLRDLPLGLPSTACSLSIATPGANPTPLRQVGLQLPHAAHLMDASDLALVTELLRLTLAGVKHLTIISDALGIQPALRHLSESGTVRVVWITSLPIQVVAASVPAVHVQSVDDMLWSSIPRNVSATHLAANVNGSSTNLAGANAAGTGASPLRYTTSAAQLSTMSSTASMSSASAASGHSPTLKPRAPPPPTQSQQQQQQQQLAPSGASSTSIASMTSSNPAFNPHPHPPHVTKWVPLGPPPDPEFIPLRHVSFGPLFHALHHPAIRDRLGPNYAQPIDLSLLGGILKQAMDPFASLKLYLQAAADCGLLRLSHMGSRCLLKVVNPNWLAQWEPYEPDCVLVPGVASSHLQRRTGSVVGLNNLASTAAAAANAGTDAQALGTPDDDMPLSEAELTPFLPLLHAFCMARMRYPPPIRTPAIGPLLKPMFARGDLAPWRKLSEYLADAEKRGVVTLTRLGVNGDVEVAVREKACAGVWEEVRERYGAFREASPAVPRDDEAAHANANVQFGGYVPQHQQPLPAHMYAAPPHQQAPYGHHPMHPPHLMYSQPMHVPQPHAYMAMPPTMLHPQPVTALMPPTSSSPPHSTSSAAKQARSPLATAAAMTVAHQPTSMSSSSSGDDDDEEEDDSAFTFTARSSAAATPLHGTSGASRNASVQSSPVHVNQIAGAPVVGPPPGF